jgi:hypothetical protein
MKLAHWHHARGDEVHFTKLVERDVFEPKYDRVYGSAIFSKSAPKVEKFRAAFPAAIVGGTHNVLDNTTVEQTLGITDEYERYDYGIYPNFTGSIGFTQRGCRLKCGFCVVPKKEGKPRSVNTVASIWRGALTAMDRKSLEAIMRHAETEPDHARDINDILWSGAWPKHLHLLDNDFFGQPREQWQARVAEVIAGGFRVCLNQGINTRMIDDESAAAIKAMGYWDDSFKYERLYTAWDNIGDEERFFRGVDTLERAGIPARHLLVYMLIGYDERETWERLFHRFKRMADRYIMAYPMVYGDRKRTLPLGALQPTTVRDYPVIADPRDPRLLRRTLEQFQRYVIKRYYTVRNKQSPNEGLPFEAFQVTEWKKGKETEAVVAPDDPQHALAL